MSNVIPFSKALTLESLPEQKPVTAERELSPDEVLALAEQLRDRIAIVAHWLEGVQHKLVTR